MTRVAMDLEHGRQAVQRRAWKDAYDALAAADQAEPLPASDLELLATAAYMLGDDEEYVRALERAHRLYVEADGSRLRRANWPSGSASTGCFTARRRRRTGGSRGPSGSWTRPTATTSSGATC